MKIRLETAKNASKTCSVDGRYLHSMYNPENEAKKFVDTIECSYQPTCVIVLGPCLSYCMPYLAEKFPNIPLLSIQFDSFFIENQHNKIIQNDMTHINENTFLCTHLTKSDSLCESLYARLGEDMIFSALTISWKVAEDLFSKESMIAWESLKLLFQKARDVLGTRSYFSLRWLKNSIGFCLHAKNIIQIKKVNVPIFLIASGPSLESSIPYIKKQQENFYLIALSSSLNTLAYYDIVPDMCISTDGGFYARKHLEILLKNNKFKNSIPLAVSPESNVPHQLLENNPIIPLTYQDGIESELLKHCNIEAELVQRNGTVSGSAAMLALSLTSKEVYAFGLDLCSSNGYSHARPNVHEIINSQYDFRIKPLSTRLLTTEISYSDSGSNAMSLYRQWFETRDSKFAMRFFRVSSKSNPYKSALGLIKNIFTDNITVHKVQRNKWDRDGSEPKHNCLVLERRKEIVKTIIEKEKVNPSQKWIELCAPSESLLVKKYPHSSLYAEKLNSTLKKSFEVIERLYI